MNNLEYSFKNPISEFSDSNINIDNKIKQIYLLWRTNNDSYLMNSNIQLYEHKGCFMSKVIQELYSILLECKGKTEKIKDSFNKSIYKDEISIYDKICFIIGIDPLIFIYDAINNNLSRKYMRDNFYVLTKDKFFWDKLEKQLDFYIINKTSLELSKFYLYNINKILESAVEYSVISGQLDSLIYYNYLNKLNENIAMRQRKGN